MRRVFIPKNTISLEVFMRVISVVALILVLSVSGSAYAQVFREPCQVDSLCAGVQRGGGRIVACLKTHKSQLSEQCFAALGHFMINRDAKSDAGSGAGDQAK
jgi:hypothetical protein